LQEVRVGLLDGLSDIPLLSRHLVGGHECLLLRIILPLLLLLRHLLQSLRLVLLVLELAVVKELSSSEGGELGFGSGFGTWCPSIA
jgi:hypothetical protein